MPAYYFHKLGSAIFIQKLDLLKAFWTLGQLQLFLVRADGMQVGRDKCRFICSYLWFEVAVSRNYSWSKKPLNAGLAVFDCRSLHLGAHAAPCSSPI